METLTILFTVFFISMSFIYARKTAQAHKAKDRVGFWSLLYCCLLCSGISAAMVVA